MCIVDPVDVHKIFKQHENEIREKACLLAEVCVLKKIKNLRRQALKVLIILQDIRNVQVSDFIAETFARFG